MKLHLGCGRRFIPGWTHVDIAPYPHVDVVSRIDDLPMFESGTVDVVYSSHAFEHLSRATSHAALREWWRVLRVGGVLRLAVPDFEALARLYVRLLDNSPVKLNGDSDRFGNPQGFALSRVIGPVVGGQTSAYDFHQNLFDFPSLMLQLERAGFRDVELYDWRETEHAGVDDYSRSYFPHMDFGGTLLSLNVEAKK